MGQNPLTKAAVSAPTFRGGEGKHSLPKRKFYQFTKMVAPVLLSSIRCDDLAALDFTLLKLKLQDAEEGEGWTAEYTDKVHAEYVKFLALTRTYPEHAIVPSGPVDKFWHYHILDTQAYSEDCQSVFGTILHHFPYFGMRGEQDAANLKDAWTETNELYRQHFGEPPAGLWSSGTRCPKCGRAGMYAMPRIGAKGLS